MELALETKEPPKQEASPTMNAPPKPTRTMEDLKREMKRDEERTWLCIISFFIVVGALVCGGPPAALFVGAVWASWAIFLWFGAGGTYDSRDDPPQQDPRDQFGDGGW